MMSPVRQIAYMRTLPSGQSRPYQSAKNNKIQRHRYCRRQQCLRPNSHITTNFLAQDRLKGDPHFVTTHDNKLTNISSNLLVLFRMLLISIPCSDKASNTPFRFLSLSTSTSSVRSSTR